MKAHDDIDQDKTSYAITCNRLAIEVGRCQKGNEAMPWTRALKTRPAS